jgi:hypothetical protein
VHLHASEIVVEPNADDSPDINSTVAERIAGLQSMPLLKTEGDLGSGRL